MDFVSGLMYISSMYASTYTSMYASTCHIIYVCIDLETHVRDTILKFST